VAPLWKFVPVREVIKISVPAVPSSGIIFLKLGFPVDKVVVVVFVEVAVVDAVVVVLVVATVICRIIIEEGGLLVIFSVFVFSKTARVTVSELELVR
jgi:hypothetical protein